MLSRGGLHEGQRLRSIIRPDANIDAGSEDVVRYTPRDYARGPHHKTHTKNLIFLLKLGVKTDRVNLTARGPKFQEWRWC